MPPLPRFIFLCNSSSQMYVVVFGCLLFLLFLLLSCQLVYRSFVCCMSNVQVVDFPDQMDALLLQLVLCDLCTVKADAGI